MVPVLLIDDDTELGKLLEEYLQSEQFHLDTAHDGPSGLQKALLSQYAVVVLDVMLPGMSGLELLKRIKAEYETPPPIVMMITAYGDQGNYQEAMRLGADDFLTKPVDFAHLKEKLRDVAA